MRVLPPVSRIGTYVDSCAAARVLRFINRTNGNTIAFDAGRREIGPSRHRRLALLAVVGSVLVSRYYVVQLSPRLRPVSARGVEGLIRYSVGDYAGAAAAYRASLRDWFGASGLKVGDEEASLVVGDLEHARQLANDSLAGDPTAWGSLLTQAEVALDENDADRAVEWVDRALTIVPGSVDALLLGTIAHARTGDYARALSSVKRELHDWAPEQRLTTFVRVLEETGRLYALPRERRPACLLAHLHRYLRIDDDFQARTAIARAEEAIVHGDHADDAYVTIGVVHQKRTEDEAALAAFLHAIDVNPRNAEAYRWAAVVYADRGDLANEYRMARSAYESDPDDPVYALTLAAVLMRKLGDYQTALEVEEKVLANGRETPPLLEDIGYLHAVLGHAEDSRRFYRRAAALAPGDALPMRGLGWAFVMQERYTEAIEAYRKAVALAPRWLDAHLALGLAYRDAGRYAEAVHELEPVYAYDASQRGYMPTLCITYQLAARFGDARACAERYLSMTYNPDMAFLRSFTVSAALDGARGR